jgi:hypothetical protein
MACPQATLKVITVPAKTREKNMAVLAAHENERSKRFQRVPLSTSGARSSGEKTYLGLEMN